MVRAVGIDPGTYSMDIFGFDDVTGEIIIDVSIPREEITRDPEIVLRHLEKLENIDAIVGPSGYGVPLKRARETSIEELSYATFITEKDYERKLRIVGLRRLMKLMRESRLNIWFCPGVIHLNTVPRYRKLNKIDMGTADKIFSVVAAMRDEYDRGVEPEKMNIIVIEVGFAYNAVIGVRNGKIVDGIGGTCSTIGYLGAGALDGELAYAIANSVEDFSKILLFRGGVAYLVFDNPFNHTVEEFIEKVQKNHEAYEAFLEGIVKDLARMLVSVEEPSRIYLSGRFIRVERFRKDLEDRLLEFLKRFNIKSEICTIGRMGKNVKEAAEGAAVIANGIAGGRYKKLIDRLELWNSSGTIFDHIVDPEIRRILKDRFRNVPL
ncbi:MAG: DUF1464 domain-containing protein [Crenarchaeota archaeon]|nr:DUF1464 domain-containing protein [Thermoproteota archaeon]